MVFMNKNVPGLLRELRKSYPAASCALIHGSPLQLLVATILSAQCTDKRVNMVTPALFKRYRSASDFASASPVALEGAIRSTGFYRNKAKSIRSMARMLVEKHRGKVPRSMEELLELPGVARKTANVVLGTAYGIPAGVVVDTHMIRLSNRLGLSKYLVPEKIEKDLMKKIPRNDWIWFAHAIIAHGRAVCTARNPNCPACPLKRVCANPVVRSVPAVAAEKKP